MKLIKFFLILIIVLGNGNFASAAGVSLKNNLKNDRQQNVIIPAVDFTCIQVLANGDITLNWQPAVAGGGVFVEYQLFAVQNGAVPIATFANISTSTFTHVGANGNTGLRDYYITTVSNCNGLIEMRTSDTISSIFLELNDLGDGRVFVEWNATQNPQLIGEDANYNILREYPTGVWQSRKMIPYGEFTYRDTIDICSAFLNYQIEVSHSSGCKSISNIDGDFFQDIINPYIPILSYVSVDTLSQNATVHWNQNQAPDTYGYIILKLVNGFWENIDTVYGIATTSYVDFNSIEDVQSETYAVAAFDSCIVNNVPPNYQTSAASTSHSTIFAQTMVDICALTLNLNWTSYVGWSGSESLDGYEILLKKGIEDYAIIANLSADKAGFNYSGLQANERYCFLVRAVSSSGLYSYSNQVCEIVVPPVNPKFHYLSMASHISGDNLELEFYTDPAVNAISYDILKKGPTDFQFSIVSSIAPDNVSFYSFFDSEVNERGVYEYKVGIVDTCNNTNTVSPITKTIYLSLKTEGSVNTLNWTDYEGFDGVKTAYRILRGFDGQFTEIAVNLPGVRSYTDDLSNNFDNEGGYCYKVEAVEALNSYGFQRNAASNEVCMTLDPIFFVPSAIVVCGVNREFKPVIDLYDFDSYQMEIFNRWGEPIFISDNINNGWDGKKTNGEFVMVGIYVYRITFKDAEGKRYEKTGTLTLLRG